MSWQSKHNVWYTIGKKKNAQITNNKRKHRGKDSNKSLIIRL